MLFKIQYDGPNREFKLIDSQERTIVEGDALYDLRLPLMFDVGDQYLLSSLPIVSAQLEDKRAVDRNSRDLVGV